MLGQVRLSLVILNTLTKLIYYIWGHDVILGYVSLHNFPILINFILGQDRLGYIILDTFRSLINYIYFKSDYVIKTLFPNS